MSELTFYSVVMVISVVLLIICVIAFLGCLKRYKKELENIKTQAEEEKKLREMIRKYIFPEQEYSKTFILIKRGQLLSKAIAIKDDTNTIFAYEPKKYIFTAASVGGITTGGVDTVGGYTYSAGTVENGKCQLVYFREKVIEKIQLSSALYEKAKTSDIKQYLNDQMQIVVNNAPTGSVEALKYFNMNDPVGSLAIQEMAKSGYPTKKKCEEIMKWLCSTK